MSLAKRTVPHNHPPFLAKRTLSFSLFPTFFFFLLFFNHFFPLFHFRIPSSLFFLLLPHSLPKTPWVHPLSLHTRTKMKRNLASSSYKRISLPRCNQPTRPPPTPAAAPWRPILESHFVAVTLPKKTPPASLFRDLQIFAPSETSQFFFPAYSSCALARQISTAVPPFFSPLTSPSPSSHALRSLRANTKTAAGTNKFDRASLAWRILVVAPPRFSRTFTDARPFTPNNTSD